MKDLMNAIIAAFADQVTNFTADPERIVIEAQDVDLKRGIVELVLKLPRGTVLFYDGGDRWRNLPVGDKVLAIYDSDSDVWGWYLFNTNVLGEFSLNTL